MSDIDFGVIPEAVVPPTPVPVEDCSGVLTPTTLLPGEVVVKGIVYTKPCPGSNDVEVVCATNDGGETIIKAVAIINQSSGASTLTDFSGTVLTGYVVVPCSETSQVIEGEVWCDGGVNIIPFYETETNGTPSAMVAFWFNPITNAVVTPSGTQTPGACSVAEFPPFSIGSETISFDDSTVFTLTPISGSVYAVATPRGGAINFTVDGTTPSVVTHYAGDTQEIKLQIEDEILDFQGIGDTGETGTLFITYYDKALFLTSQ